MMQLTKLLFAIGARKQEVVAKRKLFSNRHSSTDAGSHSSTATGRYGIFFYTARGHCYLDVYNFAVVVNDNNNTAR